MSYDWQRLTPKGVGLPWSLNFTSKKKFENGLSVSVKAKNLLNSNIKHYLKTDTGNKLDTKMLEPGISISLSMTYDFN